MSEHISMMQLHSQTTIPEIVAAEKAIVADEIGVDGFSADQITFIDEGWSSRVYLAGEGEVVYKFPRSPAVAADYIREIAALSLMASCPSPVATQRFRSIGGNGQYFSYHGLVGNQLSMLLPEADEKSRYEYGTQIGGFLTYIHSLELPEAPIISIDDEIREYQTKYKLAESTVAEHYSQSEQRKVTEFFFDQMPDCIDALGSETRLCHGDLGLYNVMVDANGSLGVIDFGNIGYYDQSKDFIDLGDEQVLNGALEIYGDSPALRAKVKVRKIAMQAIELVYYRAKRDESGVLHAIHDLRRLLLEGDS
jgi:aminoglycoside phosphotransferase (APT) family kinase protein